MNTIDELKLSWKLIQLKQKADKKHIPFNLSIKRMKELERTKRCYYTGILVGRDGISHADNTYKTFERLDSSKGYTDDNVVIACRRINLAKSNLSIQDIIDIYEGLKRKGLIK